MAVKNVSTKVDFKKYEYEDIRTDYIALTTPAGTKIPSRSIVTVTNGAVSLKTTEKGSASAEPTADDLKNANTANLAVVDNEDGFVLAEDVHKGDNGFVYYIIDNKSILNTTAVV